MKSTAYIFPSLLVLPSIVNYFKKQSADCLTADEEAQMLQKLMHDEGGNIDPEEMQAIIRKARG
jgi:hypothetical protein